MRHAARDAQPAELGRRGRQCSGMRAVLYLHTARGLHGRDLVDNGRRVGWHREVHGCRALPSRTVRQVIVTAAYTAFASTGICVRVLRSI